MAEEGFLDGFNALFILGTIASLTTFFLIGCTWCRTKWRQFKERQRSELPSINPLVLNPTHNGTEFTTFPSQLNSRLQSADVVSGTLDEIVFEPLPEIRSRNLQTMAQNVHPARFVSSATKVSLQYWFDERQVNFPRNQLKYLREFGIAWYGQAVEGEACNIFPNEQKTKVVVKIMRVDAADSEYMNFLHEARPFRDLCHPYLLRVIGRCLEVHPFLLIMEHCDMDLKTFLIQQRKSPEILLKDGLFLHMACSIASALQYMHEHGYIHTQVSSHGCLVTSDLNVKVGDYGTAVHSYKSDYYCLGDIAFPLRWCAPESLHCTENVIEAKEVTREANVWSFGVLLWELLEFGKLPYMDYTDGEVVQKVIIDAVLKLEQPKIPCVHKDMIFKIMQFCWLPASHRPSMQKIITLLNYLYDNKDVVSESTAFEARWNSLQPVIRDHNLIYTFSAAAPLRFESDFALKNEHSFSVDCDSIMSSDFSQSQYEDKSPSRCSLSTGYESVFLNEISPSLQNLRGSIDDLNIISNSTIEEAGLKFHKLEYNNCETSEIMQTTVTDAIKDLDNILAKEITSPDTSTCTTPETNHSDCKYPPDEELASKLPVATVNGVRADLKQFAPVNGNL